MKQGFTLIELLAVIVILAIIALIATPIVLNIINESKESAALLSGKNYLDAVTLSISKYQAANPLSTFNGQCVVNKQGNLNCKNINEEILVEVKGAKPTDGIVVFKNNKLLTVINLNYDGKKYSYGNNSTLVKNSAEPVCVVKEQAYSSKKLKQSEYVNYTGYISGTYYNATITTLGLPYGTNLEGVYQAFGKIFVTPTFDTITNKWNVGGTSENEAYAGYLEIQQDGKYRIAVENGWIAYVFKAKDEGSPNYFEQYNNVSNGYNYDKELKTTNNKSEYENFKAGDKILIMYSTAGSSFYIEREDEMFPELIGTKYTCKVNEDTSYDFYALSINDDGTINLLMNDNVLYPNYIGKNQENRRQYGIIPWYEDSLYNGFGPLTAIDYLNGATSNWTNIPNLDEVYYDEHIDFEALKLGQIINGKNGYYNNPLTFTGRARLPKMSELLDLGCTYANNSCPNWVSDNIETTAYNGSPEDAPGIYEYGYWTLSSVACSNPSWHAWRVSNAGKLDRNSIKSNLYGVRPVISLQASMIE